MTEPTPNYQRFFAELKRRRVFRVMTVYGIVGFVRLQIVDLVVPARAVFTACSLVVPSSRHED